MGIGLLILGISTIFLSFGVDLKGRPQSTFYLLFTCIAEAAQASYEICFSTWLFEVTCGQDELVRTITFYNYPAVVVGGIVMLPFSFIPSLRVVGVLTAALWTLPLTWIFFRRCRIHDDLAVQKQEPILSTGIKILSNPLARSVASLFLLYGAFSGVLQDSLIFTFNYDVIKTQSTAGTFNILFGIFVAVILTPPLLYIFTNKVNKKEWIPMNKMVDFSLAMVGTSIFTLIFALAVNYKTDSTAGFVIMVLLTILLTCYMVFEVNTLTVLLRKGCMADLIIRGVNSFSQYNAAILVFVYMVASFLNALVLVIFEAAGYKENDDIDDDKISEKYTVSSSAILCLPIIIYVPRTLFAYGSYSVAKRAIPLYTKVDNEEFEDQANRSLIAKPKNVESRSVEVEMQSGAASPMHSNGEQGGRPVSKRTSDLNEALTQLTDNELKSFIHSDIEKRNSYKGFVKAIHILTLLFSPMASFIALYYVGLSVVKGISSVSIVVIIFVINSSVCFYESVKHKSLTTALNLSSHENYTEIVDAVLNDRKELRKTMNKLYELDDEQENSKSKGTHMTTDKITKTVILLYILISFFVLLALVIRFD